MLANIYLHEVLDVWFEEEVKPRLRGRAFLVRYADDFVMGFALEEDARRVMEVLPKRFAKYGLAIHPDKYRLVPTRCGVDFTGFVVFADGRIRVRAANVRRFSARLRWMRHEVRAGRMSWAQVTVRVRSWAAHAAHAHSRRLRAAVFR